MRTAIPWDIMGEMQYSIYIQSQRVANSGQCAWQGAGTGILPDLILRSLHQRNCCAVAIT